MPTCVKIRAKKSQVCAGDLRFQIEIQQRELGTPLNPIAGEDEDYSLSLTTVHTVFSAIDTPIGATTFNQLGISTVISHIFYIRFLSDVDAQKFILFDETRFDIVKVTNFEGRKIFMKLECIESGAADKDASRA